MRRAVPAPLAAYRRAWQLLLPAVRFLAAADAWTARLARRKLIPGRWRVAERMGYPWAPGRPGGNPEAPERPDPLPGGETLWLHCASLGEAKGMWALAAALEGAGGLILTASTADGASYLEERCGIATGAIAPSATGSAAERPPAEPSRIRACMAPLDHPRLVRRFLEAHRVRGLCLYEAELWPNYLGACREAGLPAALVSGRISPRAFRAYRLFSGAAASLLEGLAFIEAQSAEDAARFSALLGRRRGADMPVRLGSDYKAMHYLRSLPGAKPDAAADDPERPARNRFAFLSLHPAELAWFRKNLPDLMRRFDVAIFPRHMSRLENFRAVLEPMGFSLHSRNPGARHLLVDSMGKTGPMIRECHSAFVGGSLVAAGCHNLWEPLLGGLKTYFGPNHGNQQPLAGRMLRRGLAEIVADPARVAAWRVPEPGFREAAAILAEEARKEAASALRKCAGTIFATFYGTGGHAEGILDTTSDLRTQG